LPTKKLIKAVMRYSVELRLKACRFLLWALSFYQIISKKFSHCQSSLNNYPKSYKNHHFKEQFSRIFVQYLQIFNQRGRSKWKAYIPLSVLLQDTGKE